MPPYPNTSSGMVAALAEAGGDQTRISIDGNTITVNPVVVNVIYVPGRGGYLELPPGTYSLYSSLLPEDCVTIRGSGMGATILRVAPGQNFDVISAVGKYGITVSDLTILGPGPKSGTNRHGVRMDTCRDCYFWRVEVVDPDGIGIVFIDCERCTGDACVVRCSDARYSNGSGADIGWGYWLDCCSDCTFTGCFAYQIGFAFSIVGNDSTISGTNDHIGSRTPDVTTGNSLVNCRVHRFAGHAYNINYCPGNTVYACVARTYQGQQADRAAYQVKASDGDDPRANKFVGCTAVDVATGFQAQEGSRTQLSDFVVQKAVYDAVRINSSPYAQISNVTADGYGRYGITVEGGSPGVAIDGFYATASSASCIAVRISNSGSCSVDNVMCRGTHAKTLQISADSSYVNIGPMVRATYGIDDQSLTTIYPITMTREVHASGGGSKAGIAYPVAAIFVGRVDVTTIDVISGTVPAVSVYGSGGAPVYVSAAPPQVAAGSVVSFPASTLLSSSTLPAGKHLEVSCTGSASSGKLLVSVAACRAH